MSDLDLLRDLGRELRRPAFDELLEVRRRRGRRARVAAAVGAAAAVGVVVAGTLVATGGPTRTDLPPVSPTRTPPATPIPDPEVPAGQETIVSGVGPADVHGYEALATLTTAQPAHRGDAELAVTVPDTREVVASYCRGAADLYFVLDTGDGGGSYGRCAPDADTSLAPGVDMGDLVAEAPPGSPQTVRMWLARPSAALLQCLRDGGACTLADVPPTTDPDAEFGFRVYEHESVRALTLFDDAGDGAAYPLQALGTIGGTGWLVDRAIVAASDADRLVVDLPAAAGGYVADVYTGPGRHVERCRADHEAELPDRLATDHHVYDAAFDAVCGTDVRLVVDGAVVARDRDPVAAGHFRALGARLSAGSGHQLVVEVVRGDPRDIQYAVVVRTRVDLP